MDNEIREIYETEIRRGYAVGENVLAIADTYYEYHGKYDDGVSIVDETMTIINVEVT